MPQEGFKRKLTAILSADVIGYSRLMRDDEEATVRNLASHRVLITEIIKQHNGRVIDSPGDNILAEFASVVDAVNGAIKIQEEIKKSNTDISEERRMEFRIGINLGDVIEEEERIYGDGVNIAARVEGLAAGGGIAISGTVYEHIKDKLSLGYHYLGEQNVKNIPEPVRVYRLLIEPENAGKILGEEKPKSRKWFLAASGVIALIILVAGSISIWNTHFRPSFEPASVDKMAYPLPDMPSIAVLPFDNMSGDPKQDYIADGISENIISALSKIPNVFVIARNSTFFYKGRAAKVQTVSEELGVRYVLEGSVQRVDDKIRVIAQLIDATTGYHLWSEQYNRKFDDLFDLIDAITVKITSSLQMKLTWAASAESKGFRTDNLEAWLHFVKGVGFFYRWRKEDNAKAREFLTKAVEIDSQYAQAWTLLAWTSLVDAQYGWSDSPAESINNALEAAKKASTINDKMPNLYTFWGQVYLMQKQHDKAIASGKKAIDFDPNDSLSHMHLSIIMLYSGRFEEAISLARRAIRLNPYCQSWYYSFYGLSLRLAGRYQEAIEVYKKQLELAQKEKGNLFLPHQGLAAAYALMGREEKANAHTKEALKTFPTASLEYARKVNPFKNPEHLESYLNSLRKAGFPDHPPSQ